MDNGYGQPPHSEETARIVKQRTEERSAQGLRETFSVVFREKPVHVEVIDIEIDHLYLNPATHRIRAQLEHNREGQQKISEDPWSAESQQYIMSLLKAKPDNPSDADPDPEFVDLKMNLSEEGQSDPGLITRSGVLVDGNTRSVALRENGRRTMRVGVLPESATWRDIAAVELGLQMRHDKRRDYTYINRLLAYEELHDSGFSPGAIAKQFWTKENTVQRDLWVLAELRDLIRRSRIGDNSLRLMDFEKDQEKLRELARAYEDTRQKSPERAEAMKEQRLAALVLDFAKTDLRLINADFSDRYLLRNLPSDVSEEISAAAEAAHSEPAAVEIPGLGAAVARPQGTGEARISSARRLTDSLLQDKAKEKSDATGIGDPASAQRLERVRTAMDASLKVARTGARRAKQERAAADRVRNAIEEIVQCRHELVQSRARNAFDTASFDDSLVELRSSLHGLAAQAARIDEGRGEGIEWLLSAGEKGRS